MKEIWTRVKGKEWGVKVGGRRLGDGRCGRRTGEEVGGGGWVKEAKETALIY
jgi:hypothetical protein